MGDADLVKIGQLASSPRARRVYLSGGDFNLPVPTSEVWRVIPLSDVTLDDSDKVFTVPASTEYQVLWVWVEFTSTATAGDRQIVLEVQNSANDVISRWAIAGTVQAPSLTREYSFASALADLTAFRDTSYLTTPIPGMPFLQAGDQLRVYDNNAVDAAADDMIVHLQVASRNV